MTLLVPIAALDPADVAFADAAISNLLHWIRRDPHTREEYEASMVALADVDRLRARLREIQKGGA